MFVFSLSYESMEPFEFVEIMPNFWIIVFSRYKLDASKDLCGRLLFLHFDVKFCMILTLNQVLELRFKFLLMGKEL